MDEQTIRQFLEELDPENKIPNDRKEDFVQEVLNREKHPFKDGDKIGDLTFNTLKEQLANETDWRKKTSIAAKIISLNLE